MSANQPGNSASEPQITCDDDSLTVRINGEVLAYLTRNRAWIMAKYTRVQHHKRVDWDWAKPRVYGWLLFADKLEREWGIKLSNDQLPGFLIPKQNWSRCVFRSQDGKYARMSSGVAFWVNDDVNQATIWNSPRSAKPAGKRILGDTPYEIVPVLLMDTTAKPVQTPHDTFLDEDEDG